MGFRTALGRRAAIGVAGFLLFTAAAHVRADLGFETETARITPPGSFELGAAFDFDRSRDGEDYFIPLSLEVGVFDRFEILIEPTPYESSRPKDGDHVSAMGDMELTFTYLVYQEKPYIPAIAFAMEFGVPMSNNFELTTKQMDYRPYIAMSKQIGPVDVHFNIGYNFIGAPSGVHTRDGFDFALAGEWAVNDKFDLFAEMVYAAATVDSSSADLPEAASLGGESIVWRAGVRYHVSKNFDVFESVSYDNDDVTEFRTGFAWRF